MSILTLNKQRSKLKDWCFKMPKISYCHTLPTMQMKMLPIILLIVTLSCKGQEMNNTYYTWNDFVQNFGKEMISAEDVYKSMKKSGLTDFAMTVFDFHFISDSKEKLEKLNEFLLTHYQYNFEEFTNYNEYFELRGTTDSIPITKDNLLYWGLDMAKRGYEFDCKLEGYGASVDKIPVLPKFEKSKEDFYFNKAIEFYNSGNLSGSLFYWTIVLEINPKDINSYYSRAIVKNELYTWKSAIKDYDKAIQLAPDFIDAIVNRGSVKDENGDFDGAISDYNKAVEFSPENSMAFLNRGNSRFNKGDQKGACEDWTKARELGDHDAQKRIDINCK